MGERKLLIIGIDPGTTVAYSILDLSGNLVAIKSSKNLDMNTIISEIIEYGKPLVVAGDKEVNPDFVERMAIKLGARLISPAYDLKVVEKREMAKPYKTHNQHEIDCMAAAVEGLRQIKTNVTKIDVYIEHYKKQNLRRGLQELVIGKGLSIRDAVEILEEPDTPEAKIIRDAIEEKVYTKSDYLKIFHQLKESQKDVRLLREQNNRLQKDITSLRSDYKYMFKQVKKQNSDEIVANQFKQKDKRIKQFDKLVQKKTREVKGMQDEISTLLYYLSRINSSILIKKIDNLGVDSLTKMKGFLNIQQGDILLVKDPEIHSLKTIDYIKDKIHIILYKKPVSKKMQGRLPFIFINANELEIDENEHFAIVKKIDFDRIRGRKGFLDKIIQSYQSPAETKL